MDLLKLTALELGRKIKAGEVTVREAVRAVIEQAKEVEPTMGEIIVADKELSKVTRRQTPYYRRKIGYGIPRF